MRGCSRSVTAFDKCPWQLVAALGMVHLVMAWIFFIIDIRNSRLVFCARQALIHFEKNSNLDPQLRVIMRDHAEARATAGSEPMVGAKLEDLDLKRWGNDHPFRRWADAMVPNRASFTMAFNMAFLLQTTCGLALIAAAYWLKGPGLAQPH